jgi:NAD(P)-dependent dehydrogenase (short-subunit alcohol dehydrogenase family)
VSIQTASQTIEDAEVAATARDVSVKDRFASLAPNIRQCTIERQSNPRTIRPSELAGLATFLSTLAATFITGRTIVCNGGYTHSF